METRKDSSKRGLRGGKRALAQLQINQAGLNWARFAHRQRMEHKEALVAIDWEKIDYEEFMSLVGERKPDTEEHSAYGVEFTWALPNLTVRRNQPDIDPSKFYKKKDVWL